MEHSGRLPALALAQDADPEDPRVCAVTEGAAFGGAHTSNRELTTPPS